jgi:uncharacterized membrane protein
MGTNQDYKNRALASLEGKWSNGAIASLIAFLLSGGVGNIVTLPMNETTSLSFNSLWSVLCLPLSWGLAVYFLNLIRNENIDYGRLFDGYRDFLRILLAQFCVGLCVLIGFIFLFVPGIIIGLMLSQTSFILKDDQQIGFLDAMKKSKDMMKGHKSELFWLTLSFIGWFILSCLTLGLGFLLLVPYWYSTAAHFYEDLKAAYSE